MKLTHIEHGDRYTAVIPAHIRRKWDAIALQQLCEAVAAQDAELTQLRMEIDSVDFWREEATRLHEQLAEQTGGELGITQGGHLVVVGAH